MNQAKDLYNTTKGQPGYQGDFYAGLTDQQKGLIDKGIGYYGGAATDRANSLYDTSSGMLGTGTNASTNAVNGLSNFQNSDRIGMILDAANRTSNNPYISDMVKAAIQTCIVMQRQAPISIAHARRWLRGLLSAASRNVRATFRLTSVVMPMHKV